MNWRYRFMTRQRLQSTWNKGRFRCNHSPTKCLVSMHFSGVLIGTQSKAVVDVCAMSTKGLGIKNINVLTLWGPHYGRN